PPLTSQFLNLTKNSSLAVAIGYPDLVQIFAGTALNQSAKAIEIMLMTMAVYLTLSLVTSFVMNIYNRRMALVERGSGKARCRPSPIHQSPRRRYRSRKRAPSKAT